jgi:hypothetical protein
MVKSVSVDNLEEHFQGRKVKLDEINTFQNKIGKE